MNSLLHDPAGASVDDCRAMLEGLPDYPARKLMFVRVNQQWDRMLRGIPDWRLRRLGIPLDCRAQGTPAIEAALASAGISLDRARDLYAQLGGDRGVEAVNNVATGFSGIDDGTVDPLALQAEWQMHAQYEIYWKD